MHELPYHDSVCVYICINHFKYHASHFNTNSSSYGPTRDIWLLLTACYHWCLRVKCWLSLM